MQITVEIPDSLAGRLHLGTKADLRSLLQALVEQHVSEGGLTVVPVNALPNPGSAGAEPILQVDESSAKAARPQRDVLGRLRGIYGEVPMSGENAVLMARQAERY